MIRGANVLTIQPTVGHNAVSGAGGFLPVPSGTYTIATFSFPIAPGASNSATVYLPTPLGYSNSAFTTDGGYTPGVGPSLTINGKDTSGALISDPLIFPNTGGKFNAITFKVTPSAPVTGTLQFYEIASFAAAQRVTFQFRDPNSGAVLLTQTANVPVSGAFSLPPVSVQPYTLWIKPDKFLARKVALTVSGTVFLPVTQAFNGGDGNNDNMVDTSDFALLVAAYGGSASVSGSGYDSRADFNGDGLVDPSDFGVLVDNYGEKGDL